MYAVEKKTTKGSKCKISRPECFKMTNFDRFHREAMGVRGLGNVSIIKLFNRNLMFLAVTVFHVGTTYTCKFFSLLQFTLQWHNLLLLGLVNSIFKYKPATRLLLRRKTTLC